MRKTLKEVCDYVGVTRRAVQGYEKAGLVKPIDKNKYGHLLYDEIAIEKIKEIKQYQSFGFTIKEIRSLKDLPKEEYLEILKGKLVLLQSELQDLQQNIEKLEQLITTQLK